MLIYTDGISEEIHGNPEQRRKGGILRAKLNRAGYRLVEITAAALSDRKTVSAKLDEVAVYLDREDLFGE